MRRSRACDDSESMEQKNCDTDMCSVDERYMRRCLQLAACGRANAKPNPMVGAVIVCDGRIIGEGYHVRCGEGHAEVNAFASVRTEDEPLLSQSTIYVSLEPCSHHGKTPPCADLIISKGVRRCVCGCVDPNAKVSGQGIERIRQAGIDVTVGVLEEECKELNKVFFTFHQHRRPYITLKWAQTADGFLDRRITVANSAGDAGEREFASSETSSVAPLTISTPLTKQLVHKLRAENDAILVGRITDERAHPALDVRHWSGKNPKRIVLSHNRINIDGTDISVLPGDETLPAKFDIFLPSQRERLLADYVPIKRLLDILHADDVQSLLVEGGAKIHASFIALGLWDEIRVETSPLYIGNGTRAVSLPANVRLVEEIECDGNVIRTYHRNTK